MTAACSDKPDFTSAIPVTRPQVAVGMIAGLMPKKPSFKAARRRALNVGSKPSGLIDDGGDAFKSDKAKGFQFSVLI